MSKYISPNCRRVFGYEPEEVVGLPTTEFVHPDDTTVVTLAQKSASDRLYSASRVRHKDGRFLWVESNSYVVRDAAAGTIKEIVSVLRDVSERKRSEALLEQANRDLDAFAGRVAHDLKGPLTTLLLSAEQLREMVTEEALVNLAARMERAARRGHQMMGALLEFSRAGGVPDATAQTRVSAAVQEAIEALQAQAAAVDATVEVQVEEATVRCRPELWGVLVTNLVGNAIKFLEGRAVRTVRVATRVEPPWCLLTVEDSGPGIPAEAQKQIFEPFYRVPGTNAPGTGIGLATVQRIVSSLRGRIEVESVVDQGTTFRVWLPLA